MGPMQNTDFSAWQESLEGEAVLPDGFHISVTSLEFSPVEKPDARRQAMNLALIRLDEPTASFAGVFTRNAFPGWPVLVGRRLLDASAVQGVLVNNRVANVGAEGGLLDSERLSAAAAEILGDEVPYFPASTGVIGWRLPVNEMEAALPSLAEGLRSDSLLPFARGIMTTDAWPKIRSESCGEGRIVGTAKGAGMVEPDMATMLAFFLTDVDVPREAARRILAEVVGVTFNRVSVDGETSTSDTVLLLSSGRRPYPGDEVFRRSLHRSAEALSEDVVRNGEGCAHVFRVTVSGASDEKTAVYLARAVVNAPLTKTAIRGNDPNIGRILQSLGSACGRAGLELDRNTLALDIGSRRVFEGGRFLLDADAEAELSGYLRERELPVPPRGWPVHENRVEISVRLGPGGAAASVTGSDLSEEYVKINADYRT